MYSAMALSAQLSFPVHAPADQARTERAAADRAVVDGDGPAFERLRVLVGRGLIGRGLIGRGLIERGLIERGLVGNGGPVSTARALAARSARGLPIGIPALDDWLKIWPCPGIIEIAGLPGAGRMAPILPALGRLTRQGSPVVVVDPEQHLHPSGLGDVDPSRLILVRPPRERAAWAAEQVARSGAVEALLLLDLPPLGRAGLRLARAAEAGGMTVFVLGAVPEEDLPAVLRLQACGWEGPTRMHLRCTRSRDGRMVGERRVELRGVIHTVPSCGARGARGLPSRGGEG